MRRSVFDFADETLFIKGMWNIKSMVGLGIMAGSLPAAVMALVATPSRRSIRANADLYGAACFLPALIGFSMVFQGTLYPLLVKTITGKSQDPFTQRVVVGRKTAIREGDFAVFLIGARPNNNVDLYFRWMGDAMEAMWKELEEHPEYGCLGTEQFWGPTGALTVQYWTSLEALNAYAKDKSNLHYHPWARLMNTIKSSNDYGFWHEAFEVKNGKYDAVYINMPPILLGNTLGTKLVDAKGKYTSAAGRAGSSDGSDYPAELDPNK